MNKKKLGPIHVWALGVGIVLVGEFMGWNFTIKLGGSLGSLIGLWLITIMYTMVVSLVSEMTAAIPVAGGQYGIAKKVLGKLGGFNIGLLMFLEFIMLEAADVIVVGEILQTIAPGVNPLPFALLTILALTYLNIHGTHATLTINVFVTIVALATIIILLFSTNFHNPGESLLKLKELTNGVSFGTLGIFAALQFSCWFFLGIEGTAVVAGETKSHHRAIPGGAIVALITLCIGGTITWFVCSGLISTGVLGDSTYPLYEAAIATGKLFVMILLFVSTMAACIASANGCISDASHIWSELSEDNMLPHMLGKKHPKYGSPYRALLFLAPIPLVFALTGLLAQMVTFSIFSAMLGYIITAIMMIRYRKVMPSKKRHYRSPFHPLPAILILGIIGCVMFGMYLNYWKSMVCATLFYLISSIWFIVRRYKGVKMTIESFEETEEIQQEVESVQQQNPI